MVGAFTHACARDAPLLTNCVMSDCVPLFGGLPGCFLALPEGLEKGPLRLGGDTAASRSSSSGPACTRPQHHPHGEGAERYRRHCSAERHSPLELNQHDPVLCAKDNRTLGPALCARARHTPRPHASSRAPFSHAVGHGQRGLQRGNRVISKQLDAGQGRGVRRETAGAVGGQGAVHSVGFPSHVPCGSVTGAGAPTAQYPACCGGFPAKWSPHGTVETNGTACLALQAAAGQQLKGADAKEVQTYVENQIKLQQIQARLRFQRSLEPRWAERPSALPAATYCSGLRANSVCSCHVRGSRSCSPGLCVCDGCRRW